MTEISDEKAYGVGSRASHAQWLPWAPLFVLPAVAAAATSHRPPWLIMWALAFSLFAGCKWLTWQHAGDMRRQVSWKRSLGYLLLWPGMDAPAFLGERKRGEKSLGPAWIDGALKTVLGAALIWIGVRCVPHDCLLLAWWIGMFGLVLLLHFGSFHLLALAWQRRGIPVEPIMRKPLASTSLAEFWGVRWNRGFHELAERYAFHPLRVRVGARLASCATFLISGLIHELVISVPARGGYGLPTLYFGIQAAGVLVERSRFGRRVGLRRQTTGRLFTLFVAGAPAFWLFHPPFVERVMIPFLEAIHAR